MYPLSVTLYSYVRFLQLPLEFVPLEQNFIVILYDFLGRFQSSALVSRDEKSAVKRGKIAGVHVGVKL